MHKRILQFIKKPTSKNIIINTIGNYLNVAFISAYALLLVRILEPAEYGVLSVLLGIAYVLANLLDFGVTATIYSYLPPLIESRDFNLYKFLKSTFFYQFVFSFTVIVALFIAFPTLDKYFFKTNAPAWELYITTISVLFLIWQNFALNALFAAKQFLQANIFLNTANIIKTILLLLFIVTKTISVGAIIFTFGIIGPMIFFSLLFMKKRYVVTQIIKAPIHRSEFRFGYTITYFIASQFFNLGLRMDLFLLSFYGLRNEVGYYGLSQKIILTILASVASVTQVLSPRFSKIKFKNEIIREIKHAILYLSIPTALFTFLFLLPKQVFYIVFTKKFALTATLTKQLALAYVIYPLSNIPLIFVLYTAKKPKFILVANIVFFFTITLGAYFFIPKYGAFCLPYVIFVAILIAGFILSISTIGIYKKMGSVLIKDIIHLPKKV